MAFNINTVAVSQFSPVIDEALISDWSFDPGTLIENYHVPGAATTSPQVDFTVKDYPAIYAGDPTYSSILLRVLFIGTGGNFYDTPVTDIPLNGSVYEADLSNGLSFSYQTIYQNLDVNNPQSGVDTRSITLRIIGVAPNGSETILDFRQILVKTYFLSVNQILFQQDSLSFFHTQGNSLPSAKTITIYSATALVLTLNPVLDLISPTPVDTLTAFGQTLYLFNAPANGQLDIQVRPNSTIEDIIDQLTIIDAGLSAFYAENGIIQAEDAIPLTYFTSSDGSTNISPSVLNYFVIVGVQETPTQTISVSSVAQWDITHPTWLTASTDSINGVGTVDFTVIDSNNLTPGIYQGEILFTRAGDVITVNVFLEVVEHVQLNLSERLFNFTDENENFTQIFSQDNTDIAEIDLEIAEIGYPVSNLPPKSFKYQTGFFNNRSKIHIGEIVRRSTYKLRQINLENLFQQYLTTVFIPTLAIDYYSPIATNIKLAKLNDDLTPTDVLEEYDVSFFLGRRPLIVNNFAFLQAEQITQRVFKDSTVIVNFMSYLSVQFQVFLNGALNFSSNQQFQSLKARGYMLRFTNYNIGDVIDVKAALFDLTGQSAELVPDIQESFIVFPDGKHLNTIIYADEYGCFRFYDFSGDWQISSEYEFVESSKYENLVEALRNEDSKKIQGITLNTGFIPADNQYFLDLIIRSKMAWLVTDKTNIVELTAQTKSFTNFDSDQELYAYDLSFKINRTHDFKNYS